MFTIVGAGFGLYGYLPAVINVSRNKVVLAEQYRQTIESRPELEQYKESIEWRPSIAEAFSLASAAIIAIPPLAQGKLVEQALSVKGIKKLIIEKPILPRPDDSSALTETIITKSKRFRVGYSFLYTDWYKELKKKLQSPAFSLRIIWSFKADHFFRDKETWKRYHSAGGGALRFYGIHVIATLASLGYREVIFSRLEGETPDQPESWSACFTGRTLPPCEVYVSTNADQSIFHVETLEPDGGMSLIHRENSPFAVSRTSQGQDGRVPVLERLIHSFAHDDDEYIGLYQATNDLWKRAELEENEAN
ncbi:MULTISPECIES: Gfo/Idh/MocA family oxidoreductase [Oxalobacteraceae]|uniref:Gfo/Idh/MocA family oxidoreductase n=1 Tax=Herminiimonas sp. Marseille-P9896 TaxID=2742211 RepID=UPI00158AE7FA|nr:MULTISPECIES: Gfo/Idh/MocA family oxidoreductase [Oxalobacteraceae]